MKSKMGFVIAHCSRWCCWSTNSIVSTWMLTTTFVMKVKKNQCLDLALHCTRNSREAGEFVTRSMKCCAISIEAGGHRVASRILLNSDFCGGDTLRHIFIRNASPFQFGTTRKKSFEFTSEQEVDLEEETSHDVIVSGQKIFFYFFFPRIRREEIITQVVESRRNHWRTDLSRGFSHILFEQQTFD